MGCSPKIWKTREVVDELKSGLEANIGAIKFKGDYYTLREKEDEYFVVDKSVDEAVRLIYSKDWPTKVEIFGDGVDDEIMSAEAVGTQAGLGILGFCYTPYHFVYDVTFPVLVQIHDGLELFQFPVIAVIDNNQPKEAKLTGPLEIGEKEFDVCEYDTQDIEINVYDINLNPVDANISYICFDQRCGVGESVDGNFVGKVPSCLNGYLQLRAGGYTDKSQLFSSNEESYADVILDKEYEVEVELEIGGKKIGESETAIIAFSSEEGTSTNAVLPGASSVKLSEGFYEIAVYAYENTDIVIPESEKTQCFEVAEKGFLGFLGGTKEECVDVTIPETKVDYALAGGGKGEEYLLPDQLEKGKVIVRVDELPKPKTIEQLQSNYELFETKHVELYFV